MAYQNRSFLERNAQQPPTEPKWDIKVYNETNMHFKMSNGAVHSTPIKIYDYSAKSYVLCCNKEFGQAFGEQLKKVALFGTRFGKVSEGVGWTLSKGRLSDLEKLLVSIGNNEVLGTVGHGTAAMPAAYYAASAAMGSSHGYGPQAAGSSGGYGFQAAAAASGPALDFGDSPSTSYGAPNPHQAAAYAAAHQTAPSPAMGYSTSGASSQPMPIPGLNMIPKPKLLPLDELLRQLSLTLPKADGSLKVGEIDFVWGNVDGLKKIYIGPTSPPAGVSKETTRVPSPAKNAEVGSLVVHLLSTITKTKGAHYFLPSSSFSQKAQLLICAPLMLKGQVFRDLAVEGKIHNYLESGSQFYLSMKSGEVEVPGYLTRATGTLPVFGTALNLEQALFHGGNVLPSNDETVQGFHIFSGDRDSVEAKSRSPAIQTVHLIKSEDANMALVYKHVFPDAPLNTSALP